MFCPSCGKRIPTESTFCMHCGKAVPTISAEAQQSQAIQPTLPSGASICPVCGQMDAVQKVNAIVAAGQAGGTATSSSVGLGVMGSQSSAGGQLASFISSTTVNRELHSSTLLASLLAPLTDEELVRQYRELVPPQIDKTRQAFIGIYKFGFFHDSRAITATLPRNKEHYLELWQKLNYCYRCHVVFGLASNQSFAPEQIQSYLVKSFDPAANYDLTSQDICQIEATNIGMRNAFILWVAVFSSTRRYTLDYVVRWSENPFASSHRNDLPIAQCNKCRQNVDKLSTLLTRDGWELIDETGDQWFQLRFRRAA